MRLRKKIENFFSCKTTRLFLILRGVLNDAPFKYAIPYSFYCDNLIINNDENDTSAANLIFLYLCISVADTRAFYMTSNY